jgi:hypothetical protein
VVYGRRNVRGDSDALHALVRDEWQPLSDAQRSNLFVSNFRNGPRMLKSSAPDRRIRKPDTSPAPRTTGVGTRIDAGTACTDIRKSA